MRFPERGARRVTQLFVGIFLFGIGISFMVVGALGTAPWDVLALGLINHVPMSFGTMTVLISIAVLLCWIPLREKPGIGTVLNAALVGPAADLGLHLLPETTLLWLRILYLLIGLCLVGLATGLYIGARFGSGPRDGLMTGLHRVTGLPIWVVRTALEVAVVALGWLLGGNVGLGTLLFALGIGPLCQISLRWFTITLSRDVASVPTDSSDDEAVDDSAVEPG